jgi:hypothetical protein
MLTLGNASLEVNLLDPADAADCVHQGLRYCWGGYIWQIRDARAGELISGVEYPNPAPLPFNGQGLPESFRHAEFGTNRPLILKNKRGFIIGIGEVSPDNAGELAVTEPCAWTITRSAGTIEFCTGQTGNGYACQLTRRLTLAGRTLTSATSLTNTGERPLPLHWFAHPFFALTDQLLTCDLPATWGMAENPGFALDASHRLTFRRRFSAPQDNHFEKLLVGPGTPLRAALSHPKLTGIVLSTDFTPDFCPVWANGRTWSIEPYIMTELAPGAHRGWHLRYDFGPVA